MTTPSKAIPALGDDPFTITGQAIACHALGEILFDDPQATRSFLAPGTTPLLVRSEDGFTFHLISMGLPLACLLPWDEPVARDPVFVGPEPDANTTEAQAWECVRRKVARAREQAVWFTAPEVLAHIDRMETVDGTRLTRHFVRNPELLRIQLRVALQDAAGMEIREKDIAKLLGQSDGTVRAWTMQRLPHLTVAPSCTG